MNPSKIIFACVTNVMNLSFECMLCNFPCLHFVVLFKNMHVCVFNACHKKKMMTEVPCSLRISEVQWMFEDTKQNVYVNTMQSQKQCKMRAIIKMLKKQSTAK